MENGHVEIHNPLSNHSDFSTNTDCDRKSTSDTDSMEDTVEFRLLMAYAKRRRPRQDAGSTPQDDLIAQTESAKGPSSPQTPNNTEKEAKEERTKGRNRNGKKRNPLLKIFKCLKPPADDDEPMRPVADKPDVQNRCGNFRAASDDVDEEDTLEEAASRLTEIADDIPFTPPEVETDSEEDAVEKAIGLILREAGDNLSVEQLNVAGIAKELFWDYSFFDKVITTLLVRMGLMTAEPDALGPQASPKVHIAVTYEVASRLSAVDTLPMSRMLHHGARYVRVHYSSWAKQQGGYENAFHSDDEDDVQ